ncbi:MAG: UPF0175 family protein [bacterium]
MDTVMVGLKIPKDVFVSAKIKEKYASFELAKELAIHLFEKGILSFGKACELAGMPKWQFMSLLASEKVSLHYTLDDFEDDLVTLERLRKNKAK